MIFMIIVFGIGFYSQYPIEIDPDKAYAHYNKGLEFYKKGEEEKAVHEFKKVIKIIPMPEAYDLIGLYYYDRKNYKKALVYFKKAAELAPDWEYAHFDLALAYGMNRNFEKAIEEWHIVLKINPNNEEARKKILMAYELKDKLRDLKKDELRQTENWANFQRKNQRRGLGLGW